MDATVTDDSRAKNINSDRAGPWFEGRDVAAFIMAVVMTLGPLAAATLFA